MRAAKFAVMLAAMTALAGCAAQTTVEADPTSGLSQETFTALGRYPARRSGILIAQNAALQEGRAVCRAQGLRFRPLGSVASEDPATGEAVYAVRFRCLASRRAQAGGPGPGDMAGDDAP